MNEEVDLVGHVHTTDSLPLTSLNNNIRHNNTKNITKELEKLGDVNVSCLSQKSEEEAKISKAEIEEQSIPP